MPNQILKTIIKKLAKTRFKNRAAFELIKRRLTNRQKIAPPPNSKLLKIYHQLLKNKKIKKNPALENFLKKREIRTLSGVAVITVLTKPYPCPGQCLYCPKEKGMPKSYLSNEPAAARAKALKFNPFWQVKRRLEALLANGHATDKIELIVLGGTWSAYPKKYQVWFIKRCFDALNCKTAKTLKPAQNWNEKAAHRCVGLTLETRPDFINEVEIKNFRQLGCTRVELGVQNISDKILKQNLRGHNVKQTILATKFLKQAGFKVCYHLMPNLLGATPKSDLKMFKTIFISPDFQPDFLKIYPCVVLKNSKLYKIWLKGKFKPYSFNQLKNLLIKIKKITPEYVRINRLIRDIPQNSIIAGNTITNLRQILEKENFSCRCIRCREAGHQYKTQSAKLKTQNLRLKIIKYKASEGMEYFLSYESKDGKILYAFLRLRINDNLKNNFIPELKNAAIIRELHTYGELAPLGKRGKIQHSGLGKKLMAAAEKIVKTKKIKKIAVISGIGVRGYYKKLGYYLEGSYMIKIVKYS